VDVLERSKTTNPSIPAPDIFPPIMPSQATVNYFIPSAGEWTVFQIAQEADRPATPSSHLFLCYAIILKCSSNCLGLVSIEWWDDCE
jgi:hypothetical protein